MQLNDTLKFINEVSEKFNMVKLYPNNDLSYMYGKLFTDIHDSKFDMVLTVNNNVNDLEIGIGIPYYEDQKVVSVSLESKIIISGDGAITFAHSASEPYMKITWLYEYERYGSEGVTVLMFEWEKLAMLIIEEWNQFIFEKWMQFINSMSH